jgi:hypothetical protein
VTLEGRSHYGVPVVRAARAVTVTEGQNGADEAWSILMQQALGLGAPVGAAVAPRSEASPPERTGVPGGRSAELPTSPTDQDGMYRGLLWVAWAVEECSRAFTRITTQLADVERRLTALESKKETPPSPVFDVDALPTNDSEEKFAQLEGRIDETVGNQRRRIDALEERLRQLDFVPLKVSNLQRSLDQLASTGRPAPPQAPDREVAELRRALDATSRRVAELEARTSEASIGAAVEDAVRAHTEHLPAPVPTGPVDVEGVYRELDAVAEFVASRAATTAESLERIGPLEVAVLELRRDVGRVLAELATGHGMHDFESRLRTLERSGRKVDRLYSVLEDLVQARESEDPGPLRDNGLHGNGGIRSG